MRALKIVGMVVGAPVAMTGFLLPFDGIAAVVSAVAHARGLIILWR